MDTIYAPFRNELRPWSKVVTTFIQFFWTTRPLEH